MTDVPVWILNTVQFDTRSPLISILYCLNCCSTTDGILKAWVDIYRRVSEDSKEDTESGPPATGDEVTSVDAETPSGDDSSTRSEGDKSSDTETQTSASDESFEDPFDDLESLLEESTAKGRRPSSSKMDDSGSDTSVEELEPAEEDIDSLFEEMLVDSASIDVDVDDVWEEIRTETSEAVAESGEEHIVPTRSFCAQCEHVDTPPKLRCTYDGSEIVEFVDKDHVRVRNCPIVDQRGTLDEIDANDG